MKIRRNTKLSRSNMFMLVLASLIIIVGVIIIFVNLSEVNLNLKYNAFTNIAGVLAAILGVVFAISQIIIQNVSDRYSPLVLDKYKENPHTKITLYSFLGVIILSVFCSLMNPYLSIISVAILSIISFLVFIVALILFLKYFKWMFKIINPLEFSKSLKKDATKDMKLLNEDEAKKSIISIGDIIVKSLKRGEDQICEIYQLKLDKISKDYIEMLKKDQKYQPHWAEPNFQMELVNDYLGHISTQYLRIIKLAVNLNQEKIITNIGKNVFSIIFDLVRANNDMLFEKMLNVYYEIIKIIIEENHSTKKYFVSGMSSFFQVLRFENNQNNFKIKEEYLHKLIEFVFNVNKIIIKGDDIDLFQSQINSFSLSLIGDLDDLKKQIEGSIHRIIDLGVLGFENYSKFNKKGSELTSLLYSTFNSSFDKKDFYNVFEQKSEDLVKELMNFIENLEEGETVEAYRRRIKEEQEHIRKELYNLRISSNIKKLFFVVGSYIIFRSKETKEKPSEYLQILWKHTTPKDADGICCNRTPTIEDIMFLTNVLLYGGNNNFLWWERFRFEHFHGVKKHMFKYYFLVLIFLYSSGKNLSIKMKNKTSEELIKERQFIDSFVGLKNDFENIGDEMSKEQDNFIDLFEPKDFNKLINDVKKWYDEKSDEFKNQRKQLVIETSISEELINQFKNNELESYKKSSNIGKICKSKLYSNQKVKFVRVGLRPQLDKEYFIKESCYSLHFDFAREITITETKYVLDVILKSKKIPKTKKLKSVTTSAIYKKINEIVKKMRKNKFQPSVIFIPLDIISSLRKENYDLFSYKKGEMFLILEDKSELLVEHSSKKIEFNEIIIIDKNSLECIFKPDTISKERLTFNNFPISNKNESEIDLIIETVISLKILDHKGVNIIKT